jgi:hypothetical protein
MDVREGWIDGVGNGWVHGRVIGARGGEYLFETPILSIPESQRVYLEPGVYIYLVNGCIMINNAMWTTHDIEQAHIEATRLRAALQGE